MGFIQEALDSLLVYETAKFVKIRDRRLGAIYYTLLLLTLAFVVGYEILYCNDHFERRDAQGTAQVSIQQPTVNACNPLKEGCDSDLTPLGSLPYCTVYGGSSHAVAAGDRHECIYADKFSLMPNGASGGEVVVPTRIDRVNQMRLCRPSAVNNYTCTNEFEITGQSGVRYVADIERYTLLISHSYRRDTIAGNNNNLLGYYRDCFREQPRGGIISGLFGSVSQAVFGKQECTASPRIPIECLPGANCSFRSHAEAASAGPPVASLQQAARGSGGQQRAGRRQGAPQGALGADAAPERGAEPAGQVYAIPDGDVFTLGKLLELAGTSLDSLSAKGEPLRSAGTVLDIRVRYSNMHPFLSSFGETSVGYEYHVGLRPLHQLKQEVVSWASADGDRRTIENRHGMMIVVQIGGSFGFFSLMNLLLMLTTAAAILTVATVVTDMIALRVLSRHEYYASLKFQTAEAPDEKEDDRI